MIKANELHIGNIIRFNGNIISITIEDINRINYNTIPGYLPIDISEEILLKVGFDWNIGKSAMWNEHEFLIGKDDDGFYFSQWQYDINKNPYPSHIAHISSLHDLQNLHKLITRQELNTEGLI